MVDKVVTDQYQSEPSYNPAIEGSSIGVFEYLNSVRNSIFDVCLPAVVEKFDRKKNEVTVKPAIYEQMTNGEYIERSSITIPVFTFSGGGFYIGVPLKEGDTGWIIASDRDISLFKQQKTKINPNTNRTHSFEDGFFLPDYVRGFKYQNEDEKNLLIQRNDQALRLSFSEDKIKIIATVKTDEKQEKKTEKTTTLKNEESKEKEEKKKEQEQAIIEIDKQSISIKTNDGKKEGSSDGQASEIKLEKKLITVKTNDDIKVNCKNADVEIKENLKGKAKNAEITINENLKAKCKNGDIKADSNITITASNVNIKGKVSIDGQLSVSGSTSIGSSLSVSSSISASGDVTGAGKSLSGHTHQGVHGPTGGPM